MKWKVITFNGILLAVRSSLINLCCKKCVTLQELHQINLESISYTHTYINLTMSLMSENQKNDKLKDSLKKAFFGYR